MTTPICPHDCPCEAPQWRIRSQQQPSRLICEVEENEGFTRKIEDVREADFRLANRRLQPLGHLTAARNLSIRQASSYGNAAPSQVVPEIVPTSCQNRAWNGDGPRVRSANPNATVLFADTRRATDWRTPLYSPEPASTSLAPRGLIGRGPRRTGVRTGLGRHRFSEPAPSPTHSIDADGRSGTVTVANTPRRIGGSTVTLGLRLLIVGPVGDDRDANLGGAALRRKPIQACIPA